MHLKDTISLADEVARALEEARPVVALESTVIAHGLPRPDNLDTAMRCEQIVRDEGAVPAATGLIGGVPTIGLSPAQLKVFSEGKAPDGSSIEKVSLNNLAAVMLRRAWGATTVAASIRIASLAGRPYRHGRRPLVFATGGIGGVHRGASDSFDISADVAALATTRIVCVCSGAKSILDLPKTLEVLETSGVPVVGYKVEEFPAFFSQTSGLPVDVSVQTPEEAALLALDHWAMGASGAILLCAPVPELFALPAAEVELVTKNAVRKAESAGIRGKVLTPFLLAEIQREAGPRALAANRALLMNNAGVAARVAIAMNARQSD